MFSLVCLYIFQVSQGINLEGAFRRMISRNVLKKAKRSDFRKIANLENFKSFISLIIFEKLTLFLIYFIFVNMVLYLRSTIRFFINDMLFEKGPSKTPFYQILWIFIKIFTKYYKFFVFIEFLWLEARIMASISQAK